MPGLLYKGGVDGRIRARCRRPYPLSLLFLLLIGCQAQTPTRPYTEPTAAAQKSAEISATEKDLAFIPAGDLPRRLLLIPPQATSDDLDPQIARLIRRVLINNLTGKGFVVADDNATEACASQVRDSLQQRVPKMLAACLNRSTSEADGVVFVQVHEFSDLNVGFIERYVLDATVSLYDAKGSELGSWRDEASRRKVSIATDPLSAVLTLAASRIMAKGGVHRRDLVYDWGFNITGLMPSLPRSRQLPQIFRVVSNIGEELFKRGDQIAVGFEGDRNLKARFDLGDFRTGIAMTEKEPGVYIGSYVVRKGDQTESQHLLLRVTNSDGNQRVWPETEQLLNVDGQPPAAPMALQSVLSGSSVALSWQSGDSEVTGFLISRSHEPLSGYQEVGKVAGFEWQDSRTAAGATYYYRVEAHDRAGNLSEATLSRPLTIPLSGKTRLGGKLEGRLVAGIYLVEQDAVVAAGRTLALTPGTTLRFAPGKQLLVQGSVTGKGARFSLLGGDALPEGSRWDGISIIDGGSLELKESTWQDCGSCLILEGSARLLDCRWQDGKTGITVRGSQPVLVEGGELMGLQTAVWLEQGKLELKQLSLTGNQTAIRVDAGVLTLHQSNLYSNGTNLLTATPLTLEDNYLGGLKPNRLGLEGPITLRSLLDAPWPGGNTQTLDHQAIANRAAAQQKSGIEAFNKRQYGRAYERLQDSIDLHEDRTTRLYLAYVLSALEKKTELENLLSLAVVRYPYEVRFFNLAIRNLLAAGSKQQAKSLLERALKLNPGNASLESLGTLVDK